MVEQKSYSFTATHGVHFDDAGVAFQLDASADEKTALNGQRGGVGSRTYRFETTDAEVAKFLRSQADGEYGITEVK